MGTSPPVAPWELAGECVVALVRSSAPRPPLPAGLHAMPGPLVVSAVRVTESPVGPYLELSVGEPARVGARIGLCMTLMVVDSPESRLAGRLNWGLPKELGTMRWLADADERTLTWEDRDVVVRAMPSGPAVPMIRPSTHCSGGPTAWSWWGVGFAAGPVRRGWRSPGPTPTAWPAWPARTGAWCCLACGWSSTPPAARPASPPPYAPPCGPPSLRYRGRGRSTPPLTGD